MVEWTESNKIKLRHLVLETEMPFSEIARQFDTSKNSIIGIVYRMKLKRPSNGTRPPVRSKPSPPAVVAPVAVEEEPDEPLDVVTSERRCQWPYGDPHGNDFRFCGRVIYGLHNSYCLRHTKKALRRYG